MMIPRARALALLALFLSLGQGDLIAQDQWLSETSCSTAAHAIVNEGNHCPRECGAWPSQRHVSGGADGRSRLYSR